jgi:hypothetical protein
MGPETMNDWLCWLRPAVNYCSAQNSSQKSTISRGVGDWTSAVEHEAEEFILLEAATKQLLLNTWMARKTWSVLNCRAYKTLKVMYLFAVTRNKHSINIESKSRFVTNMRQLESEAFTIYSSFFFSFFSGCVFLHFTIHCNMGVGIAHSV